MDEGVLVEILKRLPAVVLLRFRSVCKWWNSLISSMAFIRSHYLCSKSKSYILFSQVFCSNFLVRSHRIELPWMKFAFYDPHQFSPSDSRRRISFETPPDFGNSRLTVFGDVIHGVVCLISKSVNYLLDGWPAILWNPAIRRYVEIPPPRSCYGYVGFGFDASKNDFKVVRADWDALYGEWCYMEVYSYREGRFRKVDSYCIGSPFELITSQGCFINGAIHWIVRRENGPAMAILVFDCESEELSTMELPPRFNQPAVEVCPDTMFAHFGKLLVWESTRTMGGKDRETTVWVMERYGEASSWKKMANHNDLVRITNCGRLLKFDDWSSLDWMNRSHQPWNGHVFEPSLLLMDAQPTPE